MAYTREEQRADINGYISRLEDTVEAQARLIRLLDAKSIARALHQPVDMRPIDEARRVVRKLAAPLVLDTD